MTVLTTEDLPTVFHDVSPIPQDDEGPLTVCRIDYPPDFTIAYDYFRAVLQADELSERAFQLTSLCLQFNPANYTVWHFRRKCLWALLKADRDEAMMLLNDLTVAAALGGDNPKNYQIWYHRRAILEYILQSSSSDKELFASFARRELDYTAAVIQEDSKNYHAWCYRQWLVQSMSSSSHTTSIWQEEIEYAHKMIFEQDVRNNSAWNQRWLAVHKGQLDQPLSLETARQEADYALQGARIDPYNECPWRYFVAILKEQKDQTLLQQYLDQAESVKCVLQDADKDPEGCPNLSAALVDLLEMKGDAEALTRAHQLVHFLGNGIDPIRAKYWAFRSKNIAQALGKEV